MDTSQGLSGGFVTWLGMFAYFLGDIPISSREITVI